MKKIALLVVVLAVAIAGLAVAQGKPDFSGSWAPKADANAAPAGGGGDARRRRPDDGQADRDRR